MSSWKQTKRKIRRPFETGAYVLVKALLPLLPRQSVVSLSRTVGRTAVHFPIRDTKIGMKNLDAVFGDTKTRKEKQEILATSFATFTQTMLDVLWFSRNTEKRIRHYVSFEESPQKDQFFADRPLMCITAHMGSWELLGQAAAFGGADLASIAAPIKNPSINRIIIRDRERTGQTIIPREGALKKLIHRFKKNGKAAFVLDQNTPEQVGGIMADLLGLPTPVSPAPAALAYRTGTEIMLGFCLPDTPGRYRIYVAGTITPPPFDKTRNMDDVTAKLTQQILDQVSDEIRKYPQYWLWSYRHWRRVPGRTYPDHFPTY